MSSHALPQAVLAQLEPPERLTVSAWAAAHFQIREKGAVRPGPYDLAWTPYWREPLDAAGDPRVRYLNIVAASQTGKTKLGEIVVAWTARHRPTNVLYVRPADDDVVEAFRDRFAPMIQHNLADLLPAGDWITTSKNPAIALRSCMIYGAAATIPRQLTSRTAPLVFFDETDTGGDLDNSLGNTLDLVDERQMAASAMHALTLGSSTPKYATGSNWLAYQNSDRRTYREPCPHCGAYQALSMAGIVAPPDAPPDQIRDERLARYKCEACSEPIPDTYQGWMADRGRWCPEAQAITEPLPLDQADIVEARALAIAPEADRWEPTRAGAEPSPRHRGYHLWRANTKMDLATWSNILARWKEVSRSRDPGRLQVFINNWLAEPWKDAIEPADEEAIRGRIGAYEPGHVPSRARIILVGVDIQAACLWYAVRAWGPNQTSWLIEYGTVDVGADRYDLALDGIYQRALVEGWPMAGSDTQRMRAYAIAVDSGYRTGEAYDFAARPAVIPTKGQENADYRVRRVTVEGKNTPQPVDLWHLNTLALKNRLQRLIKAPQGQPGEYNLHAATGDDYVDHLTAEHLAPHPRQPKRRTWQVKARGRPNHLLDCEVLILGLAEALEQTREVSLMALTEADPALGLFSAAQQPEAPDAAPTPSRAAPTRTPRRRSSRTVDLPPRDPPRW